MSQLQNYRKFLMNRLTATQPIIEYIENCLIAEDEASKHSFHKVIIHHWTDSEKQLFEVLSDYFDGAFIPISCTSQMFITSFYTSSLSFVLKVIKLDFMFPHSRNMYNIDILFNDKTSKECFGENTTIDDIVSGIVSSRFNENFELNLPDFCNDPELTRKNIFFYDLNLLSHFKILMLRMGRDTRFLNLSNNNLSQIPSKILNFFIKGELIGVNLSNNNIPSFTELQRISSKIEKLWVECNPLCEDVDAMTYIKQIVQKFPRLTELDGIKLNEHGLMIPFHKNYLAVSDKKTKMIVEKFIPLYFAHYDSTPRKKIDMFYDCLATMTLSTSFPESEENKVYSIHSRNLMDPLKKQTILYTKKNRFYNKRSAIVTVLGQLPESQHDLTTFTVDVLIHDNNILLLIIDGVFKEIATDKTPERILQFRRTFMFHHHIANAKSYYYIINEMFTVSRASLEVAQNSFKTPLRNLNQLCLIDPDQEEKDVICTAFMYYTRLKKSEAEIRLSHHNWDLKVALKTFSTDFKGDKISSDKFSADEITDISLNIEDEVD